MAERLFVLVAAGKIDVAVVRPRGMAVIVVYMSARDVVTRRIARRAGQFPELELTPLDTSTLSDQRDVSLARAIDQAVARRWLTLATLVSSRLSRDWSSTESKIQAPLLAGAAQLFLLDRLPEHAVINDAVEWTKRNIRPKAAGLVNAVLRRTAQLRDAIVDEYNPSRQDEFPLPDGRAWRLNEPVFDDDDTRRLAQATSHPLELIEHWMSAFGNERSSQLAMHSIVQPPIIIAGMNPDDIAAREDCTPHDRSPFCVFTGDREALLELVAMPGVRVQDPTTADAVAATASRVPEIIIDLCAGQGTKTKQLREIHPQARIITTDIDAQRFGVLREEFSGDDRVQAVAFSDIRKFDEQADLLVLDVPCSNTGVLARRPEAKYRYDSESIRALTQLQRQILADAMPLLAPDGAILFATCAITPSENDEQARWLCKWHNLQIDVASTTLPSGGPGDPPTAYCDGGYFALLSRLPR